MLITHPEASGGNLVTTLPIVAPGSSTNLPTSACLAFGWHRYDNKKIQIHKLCHTKFVLTKQIHNQMLHT